jgi:hypothetical protein
MASRNASPTPAPIADAITLPPVVSDAPALNIGAIASAEEIAKASRVFVRAFPDAFTRPLASDGSGRLIDVEREQRADGTRGPLMVAIIRVTKDRITGKNVENAQRTLVDDLTVIRDTLASVGVTL